MCKVAQKKCRLKKGSAQSIDVLQPPSPDLDMCVLENFKESDEISELQVALLGNYVCDKSVVKGGAAIALNNVKRNYLPQKY